MVSKSSSIYRDSLWSFSMSGGRGPTRETAFLRMVLERDRELMHQQMKQ